MSAPERTAQIRPDRPSVGILAISLVTIVMITSMVFSYVAIADAAKWTGVPEGIHWIAPIFIDGAILTYTVSLTIFEWRREDRKTIRHTRRVLRGFTFLSVVLNFAHTASFWSWDFTIYEAWFGALIGIAAPIAALMAAEEVVRLAFRRAAEKPVEETLAAVAAETAVQPVAELAPAVLVPVAAVADEELASLFAPQAPAAPEAAPEPAVVAEPEPVVVTADVRAPVLIEDPASGDEHLEMYDDVVTEAENLISADRMMQSEDEDYGIVRYPARGEVLLPVTDRYTDADRPF